MRWIRAIPSTYTTHFLCLTTLICLTQGYRSFVLMEISYEVKDTLRLNAASQVLISTAFFPWSFKSNSGIASDSIQNTGKIHLSYLVVSSILYYLPWIALALKIPTRTSIFYLVMLATTRNIGALMVDVVTDATVAEAARANRIASAKDLQPISWFAIAFGGILGSMCHELGFNVEGIFLLFAIFPILQLFACGLLGEKTLDQVAMAIDEGNYNDGREVLSVQVLKEPPIDGDYFGMLNSFIEEDDYLDTIMLQAFVKERQLSNDSNGIAILRLPWAADQVAGKREKVLATPAEEIRQHDHDDVDWIQIGQNGLENDELVSETNSPDLEEDVLEIFTSDVNEPMEELNLIEMEELERRTEQSNAGAHSICGHPKASQGQRVQEMEFNNLWQELKSTFLDIVMQPVIIQPLLWFLITQLVIPSLSSIMLCCQTNDLQLDSTFLGPSPMISWGGLMLSTFLFNHYLKHIPLRKVQLW